MSIGEFDSQGVVADEFGVGGGEGGVASGGAGGEDSQGVGGGLFALLSGFGGGGHFSQEGDGIEGLGAVGPFDGEAVVFLEVDVPGGVHGVCVCGGWYEGWWW